MFWHRLKHAAAVLVTCAALAGLAASPAIAASDTLQSPRYPTKPTEVVIIGTMHSAQLEFADHSPARLRALLNRINPAAVGVETPPQWFEHDVYYEISYESYGVAVPWAREKGREVRPVDWVPDTAEQVSALAWPWVETDAGSMSYADLLASWEVPPLLFADLPEWHAAVNQTYANGDADPNPYNEAGRRYMLYRNLMIAREIVNMAADYEGQRVAVLIGAAHKPDLDLFLATVPNIVVRQASEWGGTATVDEVAAEERRPDHLAILWYNLAGSRMPPAAVDLARMDRLLAGLEKETPRDPEVRFLRARWHQLNGQAARALSIYRTLAWGEAWTDRPFTFPDLGLAQRTVDWWNANAPLDEPVQLGLDNVFSPVGNLTIRQRVLYELALQQADPTARQRARAELLSQPFSPTQLQQLQALLDAPAAAQP